LRKNLKKNEKERIEKLKNKLKKDYPNIKFNKKVIKVLKLVGSFPNISIIGKYKVKFLI